ncbi:alkaline phosphatase D family protein [Xanthomonas citri pv. anacardii]|uniref:alkaline phosphatase D family protein n=1 Tax=Xanthomonas citri TaxID=346 RepID=UPI000CCC4E89|nr:alkaline phosphatase D family protein [Xanthomonas citri]MCT8357567.1 alkaline phosphatase D family protein [Xanthomonas citri pv. anacardii]MCT8360548.1 alkaline phosphatase D family protein [Xanthomonas citri pv. anacardii]MCT8366561.1 alkaline phosphatase D family protein [Xanthomonas citri pv. anacardii]MCT8369750.1 alkaline phosphatase D family protein [Xanthomonas citri pv. anacardii]MCT8373627.1 alkaline phosphatase D family protein [Xanthomonas citri pv. anacardii]
MTASGPARRRVLQGLGAGFLLPATAGWSTRSLAAPSGRPIITDGVQSGDVLDDRAMLWSRADRPARLRVEWDTRPSLRQARRVDGTTASAAHDFTARADLSGLPRNQDIFYRVRFEDADSGVLSAPVHGHLRSAPQARGDVRFVWSGDTVGQGFGINPDIGGMRIYSAMRERNPDFFLHSGDTIYADGPIPAELTVEEGKRWRNLTTAAKSKVAETLDEFRGNYRYNLLDEHVRRFNAEVPQLWQWDDHETTNNWSHGKQLDARYQVRDIDVLARRARQAFLEYAPMRGVRADGNGRIYRKIAYGPLLDVFVLDMRSDRGANSDNLQPQPGPDAAFLGPEQLAWLQRELAGSRAQWKVIAADMPIGLQVPDGEDANGHPRWEAIANGDPGVPRGREQEIAMLLRFISRARIRNTVWLTADVHYCAAHYYHPDRAAFQQFEPFWEFVGGPLNAGSFGPNALDATFGPSVVFQKAPPAPNTSPLAGYQFFGEVEIDGRSGVLTVTLRDLDGVAQFRQPILPHGVA